MSEPIKVDTVQKMHKVFGNPAFMPKTLLDTDPLVYFDTERSMDPEILARFLAKSTKLPRFRSLDDEWHS